MLPAAVLGSTAAIHTLVVVALTCRTIARVRVDVGALATFGLRSIHEDDADPEWYRNRRRRRADRLRGTVSVDYDPRLDRLPAVVLLIVGVAAFAAVATGTAGDVRTTDRVPVALDGALIASAAACVRANDRGECRRVPRGGTCCGSRPARNPSS